MDSMKLIVTIVLLIVFLVGAVAITYHQWDDCLEENSFITCMRMLN